MLGRALCSDHRKVRPFEPAFAAHQVATDASFLAEQFAAVRRISGRPVDAAGAERPNVGDHLPDLIAREEDAGHGGAGDAIGDVEKNVGVGSAVEEYAGLEVGSAASFAFQSVALGAM